MMKEWPTMTDAAATRRTRSKLFCPRSRMSDSDTLRKAAAPVSSPARPETGHPVTALPDAEGRFLARSNFRAVRARGKRRGTRGRHPGRAEREPGPIEQQGRVQGLRDDPEVRLRKDRA